MVIAAESVAVTVHCRIGSSEKGARHLMAREVVHCRIGSSEKLAIPRHDTRNVHCRIGSSEIEKTGKLVGCKFTAA